MTQQYIRKASLIVGNEKGEGLDLSRFRIRFETRQWDTQTPNTCSIRVYNLSDETANQIQKEFTKVELKAGYEGNFGTIFVGTVKQFRRGRESPVDTYLDLFLGDGDVAYNWGYVNISLAAGSTSRDVLLAVMRVLEQHGITMGYVPEFPEIRMPRGRVFSGMCRDVLRTLADTVGMTWSIQSGRLQFVPKQGYIPGDAVVLTSNTGLIGMPEQTQDGIYARCLLNPNLRVSGQVQINNSSVQQAQISLAYGADPRNFQIADVSKDGFYRLLVVEHIGDTRGQDWYSNLVCVALDSTKGNPTSQAVRGRV